MEPLIPPTQISANSVSHVPFLVLHAWSHWFIPTPVVLRTVGIQVALCQDIFTVIVYTESGTTVHVDSSFICLLKYYM